MSRTGDLPSERSGICGRKVRRLAAGRRITLLDELRERASWAETDTRLHHHRDARGLSRQLCSVLVPSTSATLRGGWEPGTASDVLVFAPAHPRFPNRPDIVEYEVRRTVDGHLVLPVFTSQRRLVRILGDAQPWVELPLEAVEQSVGVAPDIAVVVDPGMTQDLWTWDVDSLRAAMARSGTPLESKEADVVR